MGGVWLARRPFAQTMALWSVCLLLIASIQPPYAGARPTAVVLAAGSAQWSQLTPSGAPPTPRAFAASAYDTANDRLILFGGDGAGHKNDVWVLANASGVTGTPAWTQLTPLDRRPPASLTPQYTTRPATA